MLGVDDLELAIRTSFSVLTRGMVTAASGSEEPFTLERSFEEKPQHLTLDLQSKRISEFSEGCLRTESGDRGLAQIAQRGCGIFSMEIFKSHLDMALMFLLEQGLDEMDSRCCQLQPFCDSVIL
ncbi:uncharacterized protein LOC121112942 [Gallus gallus]|uniref:uncharacterized protein LOC121112942 n=1 Tax=Gallus gallus TaxID=9031 RepID=UPI001EFFB117|nr:uncharacterized protein LOC121112942 [Gallus gallus]